MLFPCDVRLWIVARTILGGRRHAAARAEAEFPIAVADNELDGRFHDQIFAGSFGFRITHQRGETDGTRLRIWFLLVCDSSAD